MNERLVRYRELRRRAGFYSQEEVAFFLEKSKNAAGHQERTENKLYLEWLKERARRMELERMLERERTYNDRQIKRRIQ